MKPSHPEDDFNNSWSPISRPHFLTTRGAVTPFVCEEESPAPTEAEELPFSMYLPERYVPRYAYPVVIWLHGDGRNEHQLQQVMPQISDQNYIGVAFRGTSDDGRSKAGAFEWDLSETAVQNLAEEIAETLQEMKRFLRIDLDRVYVAGYQGGACMALELMLHAPEQFCGAIAYSGIATPSRAAYGKFRLLSSRRVLVGLGRRNDMLTPSEYLDAARALRQSGLQVTSRVYEDGETLTPEMLREIDHWIMSACPTAMVD